MRGGSLRGLVLPCLLYVAALLRSAASSGAGMGGGAVGAWGGSEGVRTTSHRDVCGYVGLMAAGGCLRGGGGGGTKPKKVRPKDVGRGGGSLRQGHDQREGGGRMGKRHAAGKEVGKRGREEEEESSDGEKGESAVAAQGVGSTTKGASFGQPKPSPTGGGHSWWALKNLVREEQAESSGAKGNAISLGWAKAIAAGVNSRTLTPLGREDDSALQDSASKLVPDGMACEGWRERCWVLRISDIQRMWEDAIPHLSGVLGGGANKEGFQALWSYLHGMLARGRLDAQMGQPSRQDTPLWDFVSLPASDRARVFIMCRYEKFNPAGVSGILKEHKSPEELSEKVGNLWGESVEQQAKCSLPDWHTLLVNAQTYSWALWSGLRYPVEEPTKQGVASKATSALDKHMGRMQPHKSTGSAKAARGGKKKSTEGAKEAGRLLDAALAACTKDAVEANFGSLPPKDKQLVIDGANVAWYFTDSSYFCTKGLVKCIAWFIEHGYSRLIAFVPEPYSRDPMRLSERVNVADDIPALEELQRRGIVHLTPSHSDDDAFIIQYAYDNDGYIVSNDNYREFHKEAPEWKKQWLKTRKVFYTFVAGHFIPTAPKILRKPDPNAPAPALPPSAQTETQEAVAQPQGAEDAGQTGAVGLGTAEEESARRLMLYDEEGTGEQLDWGMAPATPVQGGLDQQYGVSAAWQGQGAGAVWGGQHEMLGVQRECRMMLGQVLETLERQSGAIAELAEIFKGQQAVP